MLKQHAGPREPLVTTAEDFAAFMRHYRRASLLTTEIHDGHDPDADDTWYDLNPSWETQ